MFSEGALNELEDLKAREACQEDPSKVGEIVLEDVQVVELAVADDEQFQKLVTPRQVAKRPGDARAKGFVYGVQGYLHTGDVQSESAAGTPPFGTR
ncbi:hypothetical protein AAF712_009404 [Marasmius tenuissimus]|uniref:Uncharacterized protein n=1 Tax=Marasmius tenuissimus TaxID=585030 RepID=A0ABR2ZRG3_9AGAR